MKQLYIILIVANFLTGCASDQYARGVSPLELDPGEQGLIGGIGIGGHDIIAMCDLMVRDMLSTPAITEGSQSPQVIIDSVYFKNESSQRINKNLITDRLRIGLNQASRGRLVFVGRHYSDMVAKERQLKRSGTVDVATTGLTRAQAGGDFRLGGRITSLDQRSPKTGLIQRYTQIIFEMVDLERGTVIWSNQYSISRAAADDIVYR